MKPTLNLPIDEKLNLALKSDDIDTLILLSNDGDATVRLNLLSNAKMPSILLERLSMDLDSKVQDNAIKTCLERFEAGSRELSILYLVAMHSVDGFVKTINEGRLNTRDFINLKYFVNGRVLEAITTRLDLDVAQIIFAVDQLGSVGKSDLKKCFATFIKNKKMAKA